LLAKWIVNKGELKKEILDFGLYGIIDFGSPYKPRRVLKMSDLPINELTFRLFFERYIFFSIAGINFADAIIKSAVSH